MAVDNTHTKYLKGKDKKAWNDHKEAVDANRKLDNFVDGLCATRDLKAGEVYNIPVRK